jgi:hypothetical protein
MARKRVTKKLKVTETISQEVNSSSRVVEYLSCNVVYADNRIPSACRRFHLPTPSTKGTKETRIQWGSRLKEAAAPPRRDRSRAAGASCRERDGASRNPCC